MHARETLKVFFVFCLLSLPANGHAGMPLQLAWGTAPGNIVAYVVGLQGEVEILYPVVPKSERDPEWGNKWGWVKVETNMIGRVSLTLRQSIRTHKGARVRIRFTDTVLKPPPPSGPSVFNLGENTEVAMTQFKGAPDQYKRKGVIDLIRGTIKAFIRGWGQNSDFSVRAGVAVCGIRGTDLTLHYDPGSGLLHVEVQEGKVVITSPYGSRIVPDRNSNSAAFIHGKFQGGPS
jgi:hypothetical protein